MVRFLLSYLGIRQKLSLFYAIKSGDLRKIRCIMSGFCKYDSTVNIVSYGGNTL